MIDQLLGEYYWANLNQRSEEIFGEKEIIKINMYEGHIDGLADMIYLNEETFLDAYLSRN